MDVSLLTSAVHIQTLALLVARLGGLVLFVPLFGMGTLPVRIRLAFSAALALVVWPVCRLQVVPQPNTLAWAVSLVQEVILGLALGCGVQLIFGGLDIAGKLMGELSGLSIVKGYDATVVTSESLQTFLRGLAGCLFLGFGGHRLLIEGVLDSFESLPPGAAHFSQDVPELLISILSQSFHFGIRVAAPAVLALLAASLAVGFLSRSVPQVASMTAGLGLNVLLLFAVLLFSLGAIGWVFQGFAEGVTNEIFSAL
jgi:flagellar biosynthetic protein FliR